MTNPETEFTATLAERTIVVSWPDNERGGAVLPPDNWQERAWEERTLHEIDEGSISGCSVLRWRDDPRTDAELLAVSLALVTGKPAAVSVPPPAPQAAARRARYAAAIAEGFRAFDADTTSDAYLDAELLDAVIAAADAEEAVTRADALAAAFREAAEALGRMDYDTDSHDYGYDTYRDAWNGGVMDGADLLRRLADESAVVPPPALTEEGRLRAQVEVLQQDAERDQGLAKVGARCMRDGHQGLIEQGRLVLEGWRFALSTALGLGTGAPWEAIHERVKELTAAVDTSEDRCAECGHFRGAHEEAEEPVSVGRCTVCADEDERHDFEAVEESRRLAAVSGPVAGEQQNETPEAETGCAHCGKPVRLITGTLAEWWVHDPGGHTICVPEQAASSPRATPKAAAGVQDGAAS